MAEEQRVGTLEEQALQRKAKLKALREKQSVSEPQPTRSKFHLLPTRRVGRTARGKVVARGSSRDSVPQQQAHAEVQELQPADRGAEREEAPKGKT